MGLRTLQTRSGRSGQFQFVSVVAGQYRLTASRTGYFPATTARPLTLAGDDAPFVELRAHRVGAITGTVYDENGIGIPGASVVAYAAGLPLRVAAAARADDRGIYRIAGLMPGRYWVRSGAHRMEDGSGMQPTFSPQARLSRDSRVFPLRLDADTTDADLRPDAGNLLTLTVPLQCSLGQAVLTLTSETSRHIVNAPCGKETVIRDLAPGHYELLGVSLDGNQAGHWYADFQRDTTLGMQLVERPNVFLEKAALARRIDPYEASPLIELPARRASPLTPGYWEFRAATGEDRYAEPRTEYIGPAAMRPVRLLEGEDAGRIEGRVKDSPGIYVFAWAVLEKNQRILGGPRQVVADINGRFSFPGLPPGDYRLQATYDQSTLDFETLVEAYGVNARQTTTVELAPLN